MKTLKDFYGSIAVSAIALIGAGYWGYSTEMGILTAISLITLLAIMEISLSFDNAVVNAGILKHMSARWQFLFLTVGMLIAVVGMRLLFPVLIVSLSTGLSMLNSFNIGLTNPELYSQYLKDAHLAIAGFGGMFLFLVFQSFMLLEKEAIWLGFEAHLEKMGKVPFIQLLTPLLILLGITNFLGLTESEVQTTYISIGSAMATFFTLKWVSTKLESDTDLTLNTAKLGFTSFLYLEVLDASFSFDGVIGAFAITSDIVIIMLGLAVGAMFVRSLTIKLVKDGTLSEYRYLENGAHYGIGALAIIMFISISFHVPELITGLVGISFIAYSLWDSIKYNRNN